MSGQRRTSILSLIHAPTESTPFFHIEFFKEYAPVAKYSFCFIAFRCTLNECVQQRKAMTSCIDTPNNGYGLGISTSSAVQILRPSLCNYLSWLMVKLDTSLVHIPNAGRFDMEVTCIHDALETTKNIFEPCMIHALVTYGSSTL